jgi:diguanylate cyclase (GGDEF)-like protein
VWLLTLRSPDSEPRQYVLKAGKTTLGRKPDNDIVIRDESASRMHAEVYCQADLAVVYDMSSKNGTYVNRERLIQPHVLRAEDEIRIGQHVATIAFQDDNNPSSLLSALNVTRPLTRDLLLESVDHHAVLMYEIAGRLNTILDLESALLEVSNLMRVAMGVDKCDVILAEHFRQLGDLGFPTSIAHQAIEQRSVVIIPDLAAQTEPVPAKSALLLGIRSVLCVPVMLQHEIVALLYAYKTDPTARPFDQHDVQLAIAISHQTALCIQRTRLLEKARLLEQRAITDSLTGLHNRQQILELAEREFQRARRFRHPLGTLMLDVDNFKQVNDTYGHAAGDQVLRAVADRVGERLRNIDFVGRYGGDELIVLLVETELEDARRVAERIRESVAQEPVSIDQQDLKITISLGLAPFSYEFPNLAALLKEADMALYAAKRAGKNQVKVKVFEVG